MIQVNIHVYHKRKFNVSFSFIVHDSESDVIGVA